MTSATSNGCGGSCGRGLRAIAKASENSSKELRNPFGFRRENLGAWLGWVNSDADSNTHDRLTAVAGYILAHRLDRITNRDIQHGNRTMRGLDRRDIESVFDQLEALGWIDRIPGPKPTAPPHCIVNPAVHVKFAARAAAEAERRARDRKLIAEILGKRAAPS